MNPWLERTYLACPPFLQSAIISAYGYRLRSRRFDARYSRWARFMEESECYSGAELETYQDERLRSLVEHAYGKVPYYREVMLQRGLRPGDIRSQRDLQKLPILTKETIKHRAAELLAEGESFGRLKASPTSGTTGSPLTVWWDRETDILWNVLLWRHRGWAGVRFGEPYGTLLGRVVVPPGVKRPPFWRYNLPWRQTFFSSFHLAPGNVDAYLDRMADAGLVAMEAYPSTAYILALGMERAGRRIPLRAVFTSSEPLLDVQRELIQDRFRAPVYDYYGMSEAIMFAGECSSHKGLHHHAEASVVEVVDREGQALPPGRTGRLVGTTLHNYAMPLIRYEVGDLTTRLPEECPCGRAHPLFAAVTTKAEDILVTPDGRLVSPSVITHPFKPLKGLVKSQIIQDARDRIRVLVVLEGSGSEGHLRELREGLAARLGPGVEISIERVEEIPRGPTGKYRWIVSRVPLEAKLEGGGNLYTR